MQKKGYKKKNSEPEEFNKKDLIRRAKETENLTEILALSTHEDADIRLAAASQMCPCQVQEDIEEFWIRVFQMVDDNDARIRARILHIICDGSPNRLQVEVMDALNKFNRDSDPDIRRTAHKVLAKASRDQSWNIL